MTSNVGRWLATPFSRESNAAVSFGMLVLPWRMIPLFVVGVSSHACTTEMGKMTL